MSLVAEKSKLNETGTLSPTGVPNTRFRMVTVAVPATLSPALATLCILATSYGCDGPWQTMQLSFDTVPGPAGPVAPSEPLVPLVPLVPLAPLAPAGPAEPSPQPMKSNGTIRKIEHIRIRNLFDIYLPLLFLLLKT